MTIQLAKQATTEQFKADFIRLGFELETHRIGGSSWNGLNNQTRLVTKTRVIQSTNTADYRAQIDHIVSLNNEQIRRKIGQRIRKIYRSLDTVDQHFFAGYKITIVNPYEEREHIRTLSDILNNYSRRSPVQFSGTTPDRLLLELIAQSGNIPNLKKDLENCYLALQRMRLKTEIPQLVIEPVTQEYTEREHVCFDQYLKEQYQINPEIFGADFDWKADGSVEGPEITTVGGLSYSDACERALLLFNELQRMNLNVHTGCSFHIHASIRDARPKHSKLFQAYMIRTILNDPRVPARVRERWQSPSLSQYFNFDLDSSKYRFVAIRGETWEFRCFGNVDNAADAIVCLNIAAETYYKAITTSDLNLSLPLGLSFQDVCKHAAQNAMTFDTALAALSDRQTTAEAA